MKVQAGLIAMTLVATGCGSVTSTGGQSGQSTQKSSGETMSSVAPTPMPSAQLPAGAPTKPTVDNTGVRPGTVLQVHNGDYVADVPGAVIKNLEINGDLYLAADNVTVRNVKVNGNVGINRAPGGNTFHPVKKNHRLINVDMRTLDNIGFDTLTINRSRFRGVRNGVHAQLTCYKQDNGQFYKADGLTFTNNLFDPPLASNTEAHLENLHLMCVTNALIRNNVFDMTPPDLFTMEHTTATLFQQSYYGVRNANAIIDHNYFYGGGFYQVYFHADNMNVTRNKFYGYDRRSVMFPPSAYPDQSFKPFRQSRNTLDGARFTIPFDG